MDEAQAGRIEATLTHISNSLTEVKGEVHSQRVESEDHRRRMHSRIDDLKETTLTQFAKLQSDHQGLRSAFDGHVKEDNKRFSVIWKIIGPIAIAGASAGAYGAL